MLVEHLWRGSPVDHPRTPSSTCSNEAGPIAWRFRDAALERASRYGIQMFSYAGETQQPGVNRQLNEILDARPEATAMIGTTTPRSAALPSVLHDRGIGVPDDLSVVGIFSEESDDFSRCRTRPSRRRRRTGPLRGSGLVRRMVDPAAGRRVRSPFRRAAASRTGEAPAEGDTASHSR